MTLVKSQALQPQPVRGTFLPNTAATTAEGTAEALEALYEGPNVDWSYSATAEGRTGEVAVLGIDMDGEPGLTYQGPAGASVVVQFTNLDVRGNIALLPEATDEVTVGIFRNNTLVGHADEGWVSEFDTGTAEFNGHCRVDNLQSGDALRLGLMVHESDEDSLQFEILDAGEILVQ